MGPRPDGRGRSHTYSYVNYTSVSFNGAAAGWPRKAGVDTSAMLLMWQLQWGRGRMAAEGGAPAIPVGKP